MGRGVMAGAAGAIRTHLFVIAPNNSGSTLLRNAIASSRHCWSLPREGQHVPGFVGPSTRETGTRLIWASRPEWVALFSGIGHDWRRTRDAWHAQATAQDPAASVFVTSSPPFLLNVAALRQAFSDARFLFLTRNPYAAIEGIMRRADQQPLEPGEDIRIVAARHLAVCLARQRNNLLDHGDIGMALSYEEMCADPRGTAARVAALVPALEGFEWPDRIAVKGIEGRPIADMNADQIARLSENDRSVISATLREQQADLEWFGYSYLA
ncbi:sulfotransferase family protein [Sphingomonas canadensis]|uniref:Sulfotransferase family protein n=1 Tax=Sphingomonas canadensis TaxID=1219257 RepID=A0ABW3H612_9SPHN|nr:sulfotransferase [Sphingomonas canadensis]MCW3836917.1 sulfotransferase [Sphingomonas canadensis]